MVAPSYSLTHEPWRRFVREEGGGNAREKRIALSGAALHFDVVAFRDESCAPFAARPWHNCFFFGSCCDDAFDEACVGFHGSILDVSGCGLLCPLLEDEYDGSIGPVFDGGAGIQKNFGKI